MSWYCAGFDVSAECPGIDIPEDPVTCLNYEVCLSENGLALPCEICAPIFAPLVGDCGLCNIAGRCRVQALVDLERRRWAPAFYILTMLRRFEWGAQIRARSSCSA